jgi:hypothetical protein
MRPPVIGISIYMTEIPYLIKECKVCGEPEGKRWVLMLLVSPGEPVELELYLCDECYRKSEWYGLEK